MVSELLSGWWCPEALPVDVAELVLATVVLHGDRDIKCSAGGDCAAYSRHYDDRDIVERDVSSRLGHEHKALL